MSIVTISRGSFSRGKEIAEALAKELGYDCLSHERLVEKAGQFNIPGIKLLQAIQDTPSIFSCLSHGRKRYITYFESLILNHMRKNNLVYHGLAGHFFLRDIAHVLKVRINARMDDRVAERMKREQCSREVALHDLERDDEQRHKWSMQYYGMDSCDSRLYDVVLRADNLGINEIVEMLAKTVRKKHYRETPESLQELEKRTLLANINAQIISFSPHARVRLLNNASVELTNMDGRLRSDKIARQEFADKLRQKFNVKEVYYREPVQHSNSHINNFYNIHIQ